ncbi:NepR family anti-sigma factor [Methylobacterium nonmethylotrophicum]|uniref:Response regulator n=1 Tax=Methylobacterium nonmethylotrophicum TaxID=1141884 RepID=A0A4Z0NJF5_9HYPH|nr:NepR family anti-sigma factor [Methylobacterium nonmethylotrophicum]TGD96282.1 response regulator [Methylobacterium nonmethylotrophicum]
MGAPGAGRRTGGTQLTPTLSLDALGAGLAAAYDGLVAEAIPERLGALLRQLESRETAGGPETGEASTPRDRTGGSEAPGPACRLALVVGEVPGATEAGAVLARAGLEATPCPDPDAALDLLRLRGGEVALVLLGLPAERTGGLDGAGFARAVATLWPTIHLVVAHPTRDGARSPETRLPPRAVALSRPPDLLALAEQAARNPRPPVA